MKDSISQFLGFTDTEIAEIFMKENTISTVIEKEPKIQKRRIEKNAVAAV